MYLEFIINVKWNGDDYSTCLLKNTKRTVPLV